MGNIITLENEESNQSNSKPSIQNLVYISSKQHKYLGQVQLWKSKSDTKQWIFSKTLQLDVRPQVLSQEHDQRKIIKHPNLLQYLGSSVKDLTFQGSIIEQKIFYEYQQKTLQNYIEDYQQKGQRFSETFIWKIINQMCSVSSYLESQNKFHSDINSDSLFFDQNENLKLLYNGAIPNLMSSYGKSFGSQFGLITLSPQQMKEFQYQITQPIDDPYKSDAYQFGMILVQLMTGKDPRQYIDFFQEKIKYQKILNLLGTSIQHYSLQLINLTISLLQYNEPNRPKLSQLLNNQLYSQPQRIQKQYTTTYQQPKPVQLVQVSAQRLQTSPTKFNRTIYQTSPQTIISSRTVRYFSPNKLSLQASTVIPQRCSLIDTYRTPQKIQTRSQSYQQKQSISFSRTMHPALCRS